MQIIMENLREYLEQYFSVSNEDWEYIKPKVALIDCAKNNVLTAQGVVEDKVYFILDGILRLYYEREHRDVTLNFGFPNSFISSYSSFLTSKPSEFKLQASTKAKLISVKKEDLEKIYTETICGNALGRLFSEQQFLYHSQRETDFMTLSPTERYLNLFKNQPLLIKEIPLKYLASYIGVTPQALSRIRAKIS